MNNGVESIPLTPSLSTTTSDGEEVSYEEKARRAEAAHRMAGIIKDIRGRFLRSGKKLAIRFRFELHEIMDGKDIPVEKRVISMEDLALILYAPHIKNIEIRRIVATAIYQTEMLIAESNIQAKKNTLKGQGNKK